MFQTLRTPSLLTGSGDIQGPMHLISFALAVLLVTGRATPVPTISSLSPDNGPTSGGNRVVITGTNLAGATEVTFGGVNSAFRIDGNTQITAVAPAHAAGLVGVRVTTSGGTSAHTLADDYSYVRPGRVDIPVTNFYLPNPFEAFTC